MKKTTKNIIITLVALILLAGAVMALVLLAPKEEETPTSSTSSVAPKERIIDKEVDDLENVVITNNQNIMDLKRVPANENEISDNYIFKGYENYVALDHVGDAIEGLLPLSAIKKIGKVEDLADYGLKGEDAVNVILEFSDNNEVEIVIGAMGGETEGRYVLKDDIVYIASVDEFFKQTVEQSVKDYAYSELRMGQDGNPAESPLEYIIFTGENYPEPVRIDYVKPSAEMAQYTMQGFVLSEPFEVELETAIDKVGTIVTALQELVTTGIEVLNATPEDITRLGLDNPMTTIEYSINGNVRTLSVSEEVVGGERYMIADGDISTIYRIPAKDISDWAETTLRDLRSNYLYITKLADIDTFTTNYNGEEMKVKIKREIDEEKSTEEKTEYIYDVTANGNKVEYKDVTTTFYTSLLSIACKDIVEKECAKNPTLTITYDYIDGSQNVVTYHKSGEEYMAYLNGKFIGSARDSSIDKEYPKALALYESYIED